MNHPYVETAHTPFFFVNSVTGCPLYRTPLSPLNKESTREGKQEDII
jgi:hypothetical protein